MKEEAHHKARELDHLDSLSSFRDQFHRGSTDPLYFDGNSLGRLPKETRKRIAQAVETEWGERLIRSWNEGWYELPERLGNKLAPLIGAKRGEVVFADSVSVNLFKLVSAVLRDTDGSVNVVTDSFNFPSDLYVLQGLRENRSNQVEIRTAESPDEIQLPIEAILEKIDQSTALITVSHVTFKSGWRHDLKRLAQAAHDVGAYLLADLSHSVGAIPIDLNGDGVDLAVGCSYKYLNGGPGAPAWLYVKEDLQSLLKPTLSGWFGARDPFAFDLDYTPAEGIRRFLVGTPPTLSLIAVEPGIDLLLQAGMERIQTKSTALTQFFLELFDAHLQPHGFTLGSPREPGKRGSHLSLVHPEAFRINQALIEPESDQRPIIPDFRAPHYLRIGFTPLDMSFEDVYSLVDRLVWIMESRAYEPFTKERGGVT